MIEEMSCSDINFLEVTNQKPSDERYWMTWGEVAKTCDRFLFFILSIDIALVTIVFLVVLFAGVGEISA